MPHTDIATEPESIAAVNGLPQEPWMPLLPGGMRPLADDELSLATEPVAPRRRVYLRLVTGFLAVVCYVAIFSGLAVFFTGAVLTTQSALAHLRTAPREAVSTLVPQPWQDSPAHRFRTFNERQIDQGRRP